MKWLIGIVTALFLAGCTASTTAEADPNQFVFAEEFKPAAVETKPTASVLSFLTGETITNAVNFVESPAIKAERQSIVERQYQNATNIASAVKALKKRVGRTWYVFSGSTPSGWDCSGLVMWTYQQMGVELEHRASLQQKAGILVEDPKVGDIVAFTYKGYKTAYHVGIYIGDGQMIHARRKGEGTVIESVATFAGKYSKVTYTRILDTP